MKFTIRTVRRINFFVVSSISTAYIIGRHLSTDNIKAKMELKMGDDLVPVPARVRNLIEEVHRDTKLNINVTPFMSKGADLKSICGPLTTSDVYLAIPEYFLHDESDDSNTILVNDKEVPKNIPEYSSLRQALTLSTEAKKFGIAHELYESQYSSVFPCCVLPQFLIAKCNILTIIIEKLEKPPISASNYGMVYLFGVLTYALVFDVLSCLRECESDIMATDLGKHYIKGGIEYYQKMIKRNVLFKKLDKNAPYTDEGDVNTNIMRTNHMPLDRRVKYLKDINKGVKESVWHYLVFE